MANLEYEALGKLARSAQSVLRTNIPVVEENDASGALADAYESFRTKFGRPDVPPILKCFSSAPKLLDQIMQMSSGLLFSDGMLGRRTKEMIASHVSRLNECPYCLDSHAFFLGVHGGCDLVDPLLKGQLESPKFSTADRVLLVFASKVNSESQSIGPADITALRDAGWGDDQIAEAVHVAAIFAFFNRVANAFGLQSQGFLDLDKAPNLHPL